MVLIITGEKDRLLFVFFLSLRNSSNETQASKTARDILRATRL